MRNICIRKGLVLCIIVLFLLVGIQSVFAVTTKSSGNEDGPDFKILSINIRKYHWIYEYYNYIGCKVINIGSDYSGELNLKGEMWRRDIFGREKLFDSDSHRMYTGLKHLETRTFHFFRTEWKDILDFSPGYPLGIYRIWMDVDFEGDINGNNDDFDRYFLIFLGFIFPKTIYE